MLSDITLRTLQQGYPCVKVVGRGNAVELTKQLEDIVRTKMPYHNYNVSFIKALNKMGDIVQEMHILID